MALQFITGKAGAGKSYRLHQMIIEESLKHPDKNFIAVVPEQFSMETQKEIISQHKSHGSFNIEVTSFNRLAYNIFEEQGYQNYKVMDELGKTLVLRKVLEDCQDDLVIYKKKATMPGFAEKMKSVISELKQYGIDSDDTNQMKKQIEDKSLIHKLNDIDVIYSAFDNYIKDKMITTEDVLSILCKYIGKSEFVKNTSFFFDGFTGFTPVQYEVLELLIKYAQDVTVAMTLPEDEGGYSTYTKYELFSLSKETLNKLSKLADKNSVRTKPMIIVRGNKAPYRIKDNESLCHIEENIFRIKKVTKVPLKNDALELRSLQEPYAEAAFVAGKISEMVSKHGYRYNDFAVICGDIGGYYRYLEQEFERYQIPAFIDHKRTISANPFIDGIKAAIEIVEKDFSYESVFHMLKLRLMDLDLEEIDLLENYVIRSGKRGYRSYAQEWKKQYRQMTQEELDIINHAREEIISVILPLRGELKKKNASILDFSRAVYEFVKQMDMHAKIAEYEKQFHQMGQLSLEKEYEQTYDALIKLLNQVTNLMGDDGVSISEYKDILVAGFETIRVGIIPPGMDTVMVGDIERTRLKDTKKVIFLIGANDDIIPKAAASGGIITDKDREVLESHEYRLAPTTRENVYKERIYLYSLFAKPTEKLFVCFSRSGTDGSIKRESYIVNSLKRLFSDIHLIADAKKYIRPQSIMNKDVALSYISEHISDFRNGENSDEFLKLSSYLLNEEDTKDMMHNMINAAFYKSIKPELSKESARKLFEHKDQISITKLERYAKCAYSFFLQYGLKLRQRDQFVLAGYDIGNLYHNALDEFFREVEKRNLKWEDMEREISTQIIDECVEKVVDEYENDVLSSSARNQFIRKKVSQTARNTVDVLVKHIHAGNFVPEAHELFVDHGRLDRMDIMEKDDKVYVKVIDYKSDSTEFSIRDTFLGLQMQLMIYLKDAMNYEKKKHPDKEICPAAGFYFRVQDPTIEKPDFEKLIQEYRENGYDSYSDDELKEIIVKQKKFEEYRMTGLVNEDKEIIKAMDHSDFDQTKKSMIIPINGTEEKIYATSSMLNEELYNKLIDHVSNLAEKMAGQIMEGEIPMNPEKKSCTNCKFREICRFDTKMGDHYRNLGRYTMKSVREILSKDENV